MIDKEKRLAELYELYKLCKPVNDHIKENYGDKYEVRLTADDIKIFKCQDDLSIKRGGAID